MNEIKEEIFNYLKLSKHVCDLPVYEYKMYACCTSYWKYNNHIVSLQMVPQLGVVIYVLSFFTMLTSTYNISYFISPVQIQGWAQILLSWPPWLLHSALTFSSSVTQSLISAVLLLDSDSMYHACILFS